MSLKLLLGLIAVGVTAVAVAGIALALTSDDGPPEGTLQAVTDAGVPSGAGSSARASGGSTQGSLSPVQPSTISSSLTDVCSRFETFYALRDARSNSATARGSSSQTQRNQSTQRNTTRSGSRVVINGVVVHDDTTEVTQVNRDESTGSSTSQSTSVSTSTSVSISSTESGTHERVVVNGQVVRDTFTPNTRLESRLATVITDVVSRWVQLESRLAIEWSFSALAAPACKAN